MNFIKTRENILLVGGSGFIGKNVIEYFQNSNRYCITAPTSQELDAIDEEAVTSYLSKYQFDTVLNFAVYGDGIDKSKDGTKMLEYNLRIFLNFEKNSHLYKRMIYAGTGAEYDKRFDIKGVKEIEVGRHIPVDQYGLMRYITDKIICKSDKIYSLKIFGLFGKYEPWWIRFISNCCCKAIKGIPISIRQNVYFDYLWIEDFCEILEYFMDRKHTPKEHSFNIVSGTKIDLYSLAQMVVTKSGKDIPIYVCKEGFGKEYTADNSRLLEEIGGFDFTPVQETIGKLYDWYVKNEDIIDIYKLLYQ